MKVKLPKNALEVFINRYSLRDENGKSVESVEDIFERVARVVSEAENKYRDGIDPAEVRAKFFDCLCELRFLPNGRAIANAGTGSGQLANCFVLPIADDLGKMNDSIFSTLRNAVLILQSGGGVGFNFGNIRQKGSMISTSKGKTTGAVSFLKIYDTAFWVIGQGGGRRSACMAVLPVNHPDIFDFIRSKENEGEIEHFNISVALTDEFMEAVEADKFFNLIDPHNKEVVKKIKARKIFRMIASYAHKNGEPGVLFIDEANRDNPVPQQYTLEATNPCGEQWLGPGENCCMASINLISHVKKSKVKNPTSSKTSLGAGQRKVFNYEVDWDKLAETVKTTTRFLDDVIDANKYVSAVPLLQEAAFKNRRIGLSIMGLADLMYKVGAAYGSSEGEILAEQIMEFIRFHTLSYGVELAKQRGAFPGIVESVYSKNDFSFKVNKAKYGKSKLNWKELIKDIKKYGIRNAAQNTIAPTGAIATISGLEGYGCEPVFSLSYVMKTHEGADFKNGGEYKKLYYESNSLKEILKECKFSQKEIETIFEKIRKTGSCQNIEEIPEEVRKVFVVSADLNAEQHIKMQAALQRFVDNSISKTINFPPTATIEDIEEAYMLAWKLKCKGLTAYVTGSREEVVFETGSTSSETTLGAGGKQTKKENPYQTNGKSDLRGKPLIKQRPGETSARDKAEDLSGGIVNLKVCPECSAPMQKAEGCVTCPECGWSKCDV